MYANNELVVLQRNCTGIQVPFGEKLELPKGAHVRITQALGGSYTVVTEYGHMVRISEADADALGKEVVANNLGEKPLAGEELEKAVWDQMRTVYDPEIPVNIVDLGLIYSCKLSDIGEGMHRAEVIMTLTAPGCGMGPVIADDVKNKVTSVPGVAEAQVEVVFEPQWDRDMMSEAARLQLGM